MCRGPSDHLFWFSSNASAPICVKDIYSKLIATLVPGTAPIFPTALWKTRCPPRMIFFAWLLFSNKNLTWDNLRKRSWHGPSRCSMCSLPLVVFSIWKSPPSSHYHSLVCMEVAQTQDLQQLQCPSQFHSALHMLTLRLHHQYQVIASFCGTLLSYICWHFVSYICFSRDHLHMMYPTHFFVSLCSL